MLEKKYFIETLPDTITKGRPCDYSITPLENGEVLKLPLHKVPYTNEYAINPTDIACQILEGDKGALGWLLISQDYDSGTWKHYYNEPFYGTKAPWISGLTQALAASALIRNGYKEEANMAMNGLYNSSYFDGYVSEKPNAIVINAWIFALFAMKDMCDAGEFYQWMHDATLVKIKAYFKSGRALFKNGWSRYDYTGIPSTPFYHKLLMEQLEALDNLYLSDTFGLALEKMRGAKYPKYTRLAYVVKKRHIYTLPTYWRRRKWLKK